MVGDGVSVSSDSDSVSLSCRHLFCLLCFLVVVLLSSS